MLGSISFQLCRQCSISAEDFGGQKARSITGKNSLDCGDVSGLKMTATRLRPGAALDQTSPAALMTFMRKGMASPRNDALDVHYRYPYLHVVTSKRQPGISEGSIAKSLIIESHPQQATQTQFVL